MSCVCVCLCVCAPASVSGIQVPAALMGSIMENLPFIGYKVMKNVHKKEADHAGSQSEP